jgi:hypothetical protein
MPGGEEADVLEWLLYVPLLLAALLYALLYIASQIVGSRGNAAGAARLLDVGFVLAAAAAAWTLVLLVLAIFSEPDDIWDMIIILVVVGVFFAVLLVLLFGLFEWIVSRGGKRRGAVPEEAATRDAA